MKSHVSSRKKRKKKSLKHVEHRYERTQYSFRATMLEMARIVDRQDTEGADWYYEKTGIIFEYRYETFETGQSHKARLERDTFNKGKTTSQ